MIRLSKRLKAICDFIPDNSSVIDVGCDHALVSIFLTKYKGCRCLATDISKKCIDKALYNIKRYDLDIDTMVTDGLDGIILNKKIIVIAGMGTSTILDILDRDITNDLIICSHTDIPLLKKGLYKKGYRIYKETIVFEKKYYVITYYKYKKGKKYDRYVSPFYSKDYVNYLIKKYELIYANNHKLRYRLILNKLKRFYEKS